MIDEPLFFQRSPDALKFAHLLGSVKFDMVGSQFGDFAEAIFDFLSERILGAFSSRDDVNDDLIRCVKIIIALP